MSRLDRILPTSAGIDPRGIFDFADQLANQGCHSFMVLRHGRVAAEGWWHPYREQNGHMLYSMSKSFVSIAVGFAVQEGLLTLDDLVLSFFRQELPCEPCEYMRRVTIRCLLTMSLGHSENELDFIFSKRPWTYSCLTEYLDFEPGSRFVYDNRASYLLSAILQKQTGMTVFDYLKPRLFDPLGISDARWERNPQGINPGAFGLNLKTEDIAKFGQFLLNRGSWDGKPLLRPGWIDMAAAKQIETKAAQTAAGPDWQQGYGFQFWRCVVPGAYRCDGAFGQYCVVLPDRDLVVAMTSGNQNMSENLRLIWDVLLPAVHEEPYSEDSADTDDQAQQELSARLSHLEIAAPAGMASDDQAVRYSGRSYHMAANNLGITRLAFTFGDTDTLTLGFHAKSFTVAIGHGVWLENETGISEDESLSFTADFFSRVACAGAWLNGQYRIKMIYNLTPFTDTLDFTFDEGGLAVHYRREPALRKNDFQLIGRPAD